MTHDGSDDETKKEKKNKNKNKNKMFFSIKYFFNITDFRYAEPNVADFIAKKS